MSFRLTVPISGLVRGRVPLSPRRLFGMETIQRRVDVRTRKAEALSIWMLSRHFGASQCQQESEDQNSFTPQVIISRSPCRTADRRLSRTPITIALAYRGAVSLAASPVIFLSRHLSSDRIALSIAIRWSSISWSGSSWAT